VVRAEVGRIFTHALGQTDTVEDDKTYLASLVVAKTGLSRTEAEKRVSEVLEEAKQAADTARKAIAHSLYWLFLALLVGAFCASYAATIGGRQRDHVLVAGG
jgi:polyhydroxyalkanoate synthesis regulator phasin